MIERPAPTGTGLHDPILEKLGMEIASGELPTGHVLTLDGIQERFGVSRTVARETMRILESMGLVQSRRRVGITVRPIADWNVFDPKVIWWRLSGPARGAQLRTLTELRIAVEPLAAGAAARAATDVQRSRVVELAATLRRLGEAGELTEFMERDVEFHALLLQASGNEMFGALADVVAAVLRGRTQLGLMPHKPVPEAMDLHEAVAAAVAGGRSAEAETAMRALLVEVRSAMLPGLGPQGRWCRGRGGARCGRTWRCGCAGRAGPPLAAAAIGHAPSHPQPPPTNRINKTTLPQGSDIAAKREPSSRATCAACVEALAAVRCDIPLGHATRTRAHRHTQAFATCCSTSRVTYPEGPSRTAMASSRSKPQQSLVAHALARRCADRVRPNRICAATRRFSWSDQ
jgi:DNA-binding FadR family transcriptional regulator